MAGSSQLGDFQLGDAQLGNDAPSAVAGNPSNADGSTWWFSGSGLGPGLPLSMLLRLALPDAPIDEDS